MKQVYVLIETAEVNNIQGFYCREEMTASEAANRNKELINLIWVLHPNY